MRAMQFAAGLALFIGAALYTGFVYQYLWAWFVVPFGIMPVTLPWAIGLSLLVGAAKGWPQFSDEDESVWFTLLKPYIASTLFLVLGYIVHGFM